eukprot:gnl/TRDRNA2_/TRDRNA2_169188_c1_seq2.p3 gnl/TRDRNA2_/TRDRNA2_169188_c1~~gnl/TRDRNA2_/TRDRNA2_169188_c1_seq2.p3  ORF type:complete len:139 (-),score=6.91 gnl/TRDRNA2_/TRDRNA2_169188_c1_seq2:118-534(-)
MVSRVYAAAVVGDPRGGANMAMLGAARPAHAAAAVVDSDGGANSKMVARCALTGRRRPRGTVFLYHGVILEVLCPEEVAANRPGRRHHHHREEGGNWRGLCLDVEVEEEEFAYSRCFSPWPRDQIGLAIQEGVCFAVH